MALLIFAEQLGAAVRRTAVHDVVFEVRMPLIDYGTQTLLEIRALIEAHRYDRNARPRFVKAETVAVRRLPEIRTWFSEDK